jgi:hypothetical protein
VKTENFASLTGEKNPSITSKTLFRTMVYKYQPAENSQSNAEERADKEVFRKSFLNSGNLAIDFPIRISSTMEGD